jgi:hypothetical protein
MSYNVPTNVCLGILYDIGMLCVDSLMMCSGSRWVVWSWGSVQGYISGSPGAWHLSLALGTWPYQAAPRHTASYRPAVAMSHIRHDNHSEYRCKATHNLIKSMRSVILFLVQCLCIFSNAWFRENASSMNTDVIPVRHNARRLGHCLSQIANIAQKVN